MFNDELKNLVKKRTDEEEVKAKKTVVTSEFGKFTKNEVPKMMTIYGDMLI